MSKKFWISVIAVFVVSMLLGLVIHGMILKPEYAALPSLFRSDEDAAGYFHFMLIAHLVMAGALTWIYRQGRSSGVPWLTQGIRFGIAIGLLMAFTMYTIYYAVQPTPGMLTVKQIVFDMVGMVIIGIVLAFINREE